MGIYFKGHIKTSLIDYPQKISTVLFAAGCNFRCDYCHNAPLLDKNESDIKEEELLDFLKKRKKYLDAICLSGGEITLYKELPEFIRKVKEMGYLVKIDTNGTNPFLLRQLICESIVDYVAMDIKAPFDKYEDIVNSTVNINIIKESIKMIIDSGIDYEFRTTVCKELLDIDDIMSIAKEIKGAKRYCIQNFKDRETVLIGKGKLTPYEAELLLKIKQDLSGYFGELIIRNI